MFNFIVMRAFASSITYLLVGLIMMFSACTTISSEKEKERPFLGYHVLLDSIIRTKQGLFRGLELNARSEEILAVEGRKPNKMEQGHLFYDYQIDSITNYNIDYTINNDSLEEISLQINCKDLDLCAYLFCDFKDYYGYRIPNPREDKGYVVYNCVEGERRPFVISLSDNSSPNQGILNLIIYKDK